MTADSNSDRAFHRPPSRLKESIFFLHVVLRIWSDMFFRMSETCHTENQPLGAHCLSSLPSMTDVDLNSGSGVYSCMHMFIGVGNVAGDGCRQFTANPSQD